MSKRPGRPPLAGEIDAVVVGAGFGGMYMLHKLRELGVSVQGFEAGSDVGGTWYWNRYPGARCDIPSLFYSYTWDEALQKEWRWSEKYAAQPEILAYAEPRRRPLRPAPDDRLRDPRGFGDLRRGRRPLARRHRPRRRACRALADHGDRAAFRRRARRPFPASTASKGATYHTGAWPHEGVDFTGKRVAVIGTGSSGIQSIPQIAAQAEHVTVFQRTPNF